ncbi:MAG: hypothetical protein H0W34_14445 [Pyrinomonadaceae bacterium]|nr:hypothetical protein [Pyrinomonadaceae bacterium]
MRFSGRQKGFDATKLSWGGRISLAQSGWMGIEFFKERAVLIVHRRVRLVLTLLLS